MYRILALLSLIVVLSSINFVNAQQRTFNDCYSDFVTAILTASTFTPVNVDMTDPQLKSYITNACNFYHQRTGIWYSYNNEPDPVLTNEFFRLYGDSIPPSIIELGQAMK